MAKRIYWKEHLESLNDAVLGVENRVFKQKVLSYGEGLAILCGLIKSGSYEREDTNMVVKLGIKGVRPKMQLFWFGVEASVNLAVMSVCPKCDVQCSYRGEHNECLPRARFGKGWECYAK